TCAEPRQEQDFATEIRRLDIGALPEPRVRLVERMRDCKSWELDEKDVVVGVGPTVDPGVLAAIDGTDAALAGTREACAAGLVERTRQVGLLGRPVAPRPSIGIGVGGGLEHRGGAGKARGTRPTR